MIIPGLVVTVLTFPGVIVHEIAHQLFCRWLGVAVFDVCYFRFGNPAGYVVHEAPRTFFQSLLISIGPFIINSIVGVLIAFPSVMPLTQFDSGTPVDVVLLWLGISIAMHAFPSTGDAISLWQSAKHLHGGVAQIFAAPIVGLIYVGAVGSVFWLDLVFGVTICCGIPNLLVLVLA